MTQNFFAHSAQLQYQSITHSVVHVKLAQFRFFTHHGFLMNVQMSDSQPVNDHFFQVKFKCFFRIIFCSTSLWNQIGPINIIQPLSSVH